MRRRLARPKMGRAAREGLVWQSTSMLGDERRIHIKPHRVVRHFTLIFLCIFMQVTIVSGTECGLHRGPESLAAAFVRIPASHPRCAHLDTQSSSHSFWCSLVRRSSTARSYRTSMTATTSLTTAVVLTLGMLLLEDQLCETRTIAKTIGP